MVNTRPYDSTLRRQRAELARERVLAVAEERFLADGYSATTVEAVATRAGVSAATVYKVHGGKSGLARTLCHRALQGTGSRPAEERSDDLLAGADLQTVLVGWGRLAAEVAPRVAPLLLVLSEAARSDEDAAVLLATLERERLQRMRGLASTLVASGRLRRGLEARDVRDVLWVCTSPELYELLVVRRRWTAAEFGRFVTDTLRGSLT